MTPKHQLLEQGDMVYKPTGELFIFDWKRSTKLVNDIGAVIKSDFEYRFDEA